MSDEHTITGQIALYPPSGTREPTYFLESRVPEKIAQGWTYSPAQPKSTRRRTPVTTSATTDKPELQSQGTED